MAIGYLVPCKGVRPPDADTADTLAGVDPKVDVGVTTEVTLDCMASVAALVFSHVYGATDFAWEAVVVVVECDTSRYSDSRTGGRVSLPTSEDEGCELADTSTFGTMLVLTDSYKHGHVFKGALTSSLVNLEPCLHYHPVDVVRFGHFSTNNISSLSCLAVFVVVVRVASYSSGK